MRSKLSKKQRKNLIKFVIRESKRDLKWIKLRRWVEIQHIDNIVMYLLFNENLDKITHEYLLRLSVELNRIRDKFKSSTMPYRAFKQLLKPLIIMYKRI